MAAKSNKRDAEGGVIEEYTAAMSKKQRMYCEELVESEMSGHSEAIKEDGCTTRQSSNATSIIQVSF